MGDLHARSPRQLQDEQLDSHVTEKPAHTKQPSLSRSRRSGKSRGKNDGFSPRLLLIEEIIDEIDSIEMGGSSRGLVADLNFGSAAAAAGFSISRELE